MARRAAQAQARHGRRTGYLHRLARANAGLDLRGKVVHAWIEHDE